MKIWKWNKCFIFWRFQIIFLKHIWLWNPRIHKFYKEKKKSNKTEKQVLRGEAFIKIKINHRHMYIKKPNGHENAAPIRSISITNILTSFPLYISVLKASNLLQGPSLYVFSSLFSCLVCPTTENLFLSPRISLLPLQTSGEDCVCVCDCMCLCVCVCECVWLIH